VATRRTTKAVASVAILLAGTIFVLASSFNLDGTARLVEPKPDVPTNYRQIITQRINEVVKPPLRLRDHFIGRPNEDDEVSFMVDAGLGPQWFKCKFSRGEIVSIQPW
jgi:hypothetical protein